MPSGENLPTRIGNGHRKETLDLGPGGTKDSLASMTPCVPVGHRLGQDRLGFCLS